MVFDVSLLSTSEVLFEGKANSVVLPGEQGVFEILAFHNNFLSRLISGQVFIDEKNFSIKRGIVKVSSNKVTIIIEEQY